MTTPADQRPLTILIAADTYPPHINGAAQFGYRLAKGMTGRGHNVHVLACRADNGKSFTEFRPEGTVHRLRSHGVPTHEYFRICLPWEIKKEISLLFDRVKPDVVHIQSHYMIGEHVLYEAVKRGVRIVATNHFMPENLNPFLPFPQWFKDIIGRISWKDMGKVMGKADVVTTPTPLAAKAMHQHAFLRKVLPLSNGIDSAAYELQPGEQIEPHPYPTVMFAGRLAEEKHVDVLIEAVSKTPPELNVHLEIVGGGEVRSSLEELVRRLHMTDRVKFLGLASDEELRRAYIQADLFCMPGTAELQSLVTLEAMSASTPVVLADAMALPHLVRDGENGYLFTPNDSDDLAKKITMVLELPADQREAMGQASRQMVEPHSIEGTLQTFEDLYRGARFEDKVV
ncbi:MULTISPECIES: glycosyltransferase [Pseudarthrobacter]|uniref:D-inositol 3-phosphate glycosyltransferase n=1 Tax=Pseudarthrobacter oxydans TaxID=1671 RepID=A0AAW8N7I3_PSEOX|nr:MULTISPECIES: glycosyltransferase [Pseudarthrobacter]MDV2977539.1 glycosyltransferase [Actinomycetes bacterium ARC8]WHP60685.1 glycosyltransferase [Arthrobacter sp. KFRI-F3372]MDR6791420.1 glycosyltransferase involved in cell wall biosynthesis [Pseudarthrobacter oxydans]MDR7162930.1 glycosyltransferase involved in cell wall biosynthesis [Pseudarthrobacter oxydans]NSX37251.1 glycosyltransferase [Pseudarthrobacter oxydans]